MQRFCAYQDRCHEEVRRKLINLGVYGDRLEEIMSELITDNFLNEERFARSFARGKFRIKQWGRLRIRRELQGRNISDYCIRKAMEEVSEHEYIEVAKQLVIKKLEGENGQDPFQRRAKVAAAVIRKGYESELVWNLIKEQEI